LRDLPVLTFEWYPDIQNALTKGITMDRYVADPQIVVAGMRLDMRRAGSGRPLLMLGGLESWIRDDDYFDALARRFDVIIPQHPGFGASERPAHVAGVADLALTYLSMLEELNLRDVLLVGASFGGWVAAEVAVRSTERLAGLVLVDALGVKHGGRTDRDIADIYAMSNADVAAHFYHDPARNRRDLTQMPEHVLTGIARSRETMALFGWKPYMHNPSLKPWLRRIDIPTLVLWGESDRMVRPDYGRAYAAAIPGARFVSIPEAGHYPHIEQPQRFVAEIEQFAAGLAPKRQVA
jgi:pimeloyl-ACP methyl ester carboxylesterase